MARVMDVVDTKLYRSVAYARAAPDEDVVVFTWGPYLHRPTALQVCASKLHELAERGYLSVTVFVEETSTNWTKSD